MSSKPKSTLAETPMKRASSINASKITRISRGVTKSDSATPLQSSRVSNDRSPRPVNSKPASDGTRVSAKISADRRSSKLSTPPEPTRPLKGSDLQLQLNHIQEDLKKVNEQLTLVEKEKEDAVSELKDVQKLVGETNEKTNEALVARKQAEEDSEIEKFRSLEIEHVEIEASLKKKEDLKKEIEDARNQLALDVSALLSATQELDKLKQELAKTCDAKNQALVHADDVTKIAEVHAQKAETLSSEIVHLKDLLNSELEAEDNEKNKEVAELKSKIESLETELQGKGNFDKKLIEKEASIEQLNVKIEASRMAETYALNLVEEWQLRIKELESQVKEANRLELSASQSLTSVKKKLESNIGLLKESESKIGGLKEKTELLEISIQSQRGDLEESGRHLHLAEREANKMAKMVDFLKAELDSMSEEKVQAENNEKLATSSVQTLLEEKSNLVIELESSKEEEEKNKKAMEILATALHEASSEAREAKERYLSVRAEYESYETQVEDLKSELKEMNHKYENMLDHSKHELDILVNTIDVSKYEFESSMAQWEQKELHLLNRVEQLKEDKSYLEAKKEELVHSIEETQEETRSKKEENIHLRDMLKEAESEVKYLKEVLGEAQAESVKLKENLLDKENELQSVVEENEEIQSREAVSLKKIEELTKLLDEMVSNKRNGESGELTDSEKDYDLLPKVIEFSEENGNGNGHEEKMITDLPSSKLDEPTNHNSQNKDNGHADSEAIQTRSSFENGKKMDNETNVKEKVVENESKMWESCQIDEKDYSPDRETENESLEEVEETNSMAESADTVDQANGSPEQLENGSISPTKLEKKKALLYKFGNLLKKKGTATKERAVR